jgi:hypothetical protein
MDRSTLEDEQRLTGGPDGGDGGPEPEPYPEVPNVPEGDGSLLARLNARREEIAREETPVFDVDVPGYELEPGSLSALVLRCRYPEGGWKVITDAITRANDKRNPEGALYGNADVLIACCSEVLGRDPKTGDLAPLDPQAGEDVPPVRLTTRLAELLQIDVPSEVKSKGRFVTRHVFSPRAQATGIYDGDLVLMTTGGRVITWLQGERERQGEDFAGE